MVDQHEGQHGRLRVERADAATEHQRGKQHTGIADQRAIGADQAGRAKKGPVGRGGLRHQKADRQAGADAEQDHQHEDRLPAGICQRQTTERRAGGRSDGQHDADHVEDAGGLRATELVADDGARHGNADRGADALDQAPGQKPVDRGCEGGNQAAQDIDHQEGKGGLPAPEGIGDRTGNELGDGEAAEIERKAELDRTLRRGESIDQFGHGRCVDGHGDGADGGQECADQRGAALAHASLCHAVPVSRIGLSTSLIYRRAVRSMDRWTIRPRERFGDRSNATLMTP